jgi:tRNA(Ile)-lysidine synthase
MNVNKEIEAALLRSFPGPALFVLAVSGGPDSQALLKAFPHVARRLGHDVRACGIVHGLRPASETHAEMMIARELAEAVGVPFSITSCCMKHGPNVQARARDVRYRALRDHASFCWSALPPGGKERLSGGMAVVTAHHADDRAETVLIRLLRGAGAGALGVLPEVARSSDPAAVPLSLFRPLLRVRRADLLRYVGRWGLPYATDPSNSDEKYLRVWVRNKLMPLLAERSPRINEKLCQIADDLLRTAGRPAAGLGGPRQDEEGLLGRDKDVDEFLREVDEAVVSGMTES